MSFRHVFNTSYLKDPDIHILMFISESEVNNIIREALRDYMVKHGSKAAEPEYQAKVFMTASMQMARGIRAVASDVLAEMGEAPVVRSAAAAPRQATARRKVAPSADTLSASVVPPASPAAAIPAAPVVAHAPVEAAVAQAPVIQPPAAAPAPDLFELPAPKASKPAVVLDFGPEIEMSGTADGAEAGKKPSQRENWLARHKS